MNINIKATNMELTDAITDYVHKKLSSLEKYVREGDVSGYVEVGKTTHHHNKGEFFKAEFDIVINATHFFASSEQDNLYTAIDDAKEEIVRTITHTKDRHQTLFKRGAVSIKKMLKGISKRNPFTSKYEE
jgi:putative sigma-54 modulation protein